MQLTIALAAIVCTGALVVAGCALQGSSTTTPEELGPDTVFASDEQALAAATDAYTTYQSTLGEISRDGGMLAERIASAVTNERLSKELHGFRTLTESGRRLEGDLRVGVTTLQQHTVNEVGITAVVIIACLHGSGAAILDSAGADVTPAALRQPWPRLVSFEALGDARSQMLIAGDEPWAGTNPC